IKYICFKFVIVNDDFLDKKLNERKEQNAFRTLRLPTQKIDFCSNDYLGIIKSNLIEANEAKHGSSGPRSLTGNSTLVEETEKIIVDFHEAEAGLIFNSGYNANVGLLSCVPQKNDVIL